MMRTNKEYAREEFEALANRKPNLHGDWIYRLEISWIDVDEELSYPEFELLTRYISAPSRKLKIILRQPQTTMGYIVV